MRLQALAAALGLLAASLTTERATALSIPESYQAVIQAVGWQPADVPTLVEVIQCESGFNSLAVGTAGELGLMQMLPATWEAARDYDPEVPAVWEHWQNAASQLYVGRVIHDAEGWRPWTCGP